jgi:integrase
MLLLLLYCTGIRFGEALLLRFCDVDVRAGVLFIGMFKGRARWVPFHRSLAQEMGKYLLARQAFTGGLAGPDERFFIGANGTMLSVSSAGHTIPLWPETAAALRQIVNAEAENETVFRNSRG